MGIVKRTKDSGRGKTDHVQPELLSEELRNLETVTLWGGGVFEKKGPELGQESGEPQDVRGGKGVHGDMEGQVQKRFYRSIISRIQVEGVSIGGGSPVNSGRKTKKRGITSLE